jgi:hypothetical protein
MVIHYMIMTVAQTMVPPLLGQTATSQRVFFMISVCSWSLSPSQRSVVRFDFEILDLSKFVTWVPATVGFSGIEISRRDRRLMDTKIRRESFAKFKIKTKSTLAQRDTRTRFTVNRAVSTMAETWTFSTMGTRSIHESKERMNPRQDDKLLISRQPAVLNDRLAD